MSGTCKLSGDHRHQLYCFFLSLQSLYYDVEQTGSLTMLKKRKLRLTAVKSLTHDHSLRNIKLKLNPRLSVSSDFFLLQEMIQVFISDVFLKLTG